MVNYGHGIFFFICVLLGELFLGLGSVSLPHESTVNCATEIKILIFSTKMLSIQSTVPTKEPNKTTKRATSPLMTKLHCIGHSSDCISDLYCIALQHHSLLPPIKLNHRVIKSWVHFEKQSLYFHFGRFVADTLKLSQPQDFLKPLTRSIQPTKNHKHFIHWTVLDIM